ncbi:hypothetical protein [Parafrankia elaeagni]|uniref:hypothetical protein n=1 Tax=Parafrankia elaeagni TaxID=222534 RepID=UPI00036F8D6B|nr:hypothetical protein [Parafrankia elaeagni]
MSDTSGGLRLAAEIGTGTSGALVVFALILASVALFVFLSRSLRRMRANVASGEFGSGPADRRVAPGGPAPESTSTGDGSGAGTGEAGAAPGGDRAAAVATTSAGAAGTGTLPRQREGKGVGEDVGTDPA